MLSFPLKQDIVRPVISASEVVDALFSARFDGTTLVPENLSVDIVIDGQKKNITITGEELLSCVSVVINAKNLKAVLAAHIDANGNTL
jgi:hypothetical protein